MTHLLCPNCKNNYCDREEINVGVGICHGPWYCKKCNWNAEDDILKALKNEFTFEISTNSVDIK